MSFQIKTYNEIVTEMINFIKSLQSRITDFSVGTVMRAFIEAVAFEVDESYYRLYQNFIGQFISTAKDTDLDNLVIPLNITRETKRYAAGYLIVSNITSAIANVPIPIGSRVISRADDNGTVKEYETQELKILKTDDIILKAKGISIKYQGTGTLAVLTIATGNFQTFIDSILDIDLSLLDTRYDSLVELVAEINQYTDYTARILAESTESNASIDLLDVTTVNIKNIDYEAIRKDRIRCQAIEAGLDSNIPENYIEGLKTAIAGIASITNDLPIDGGMDAETDDQLRSRALNQMVILSLGISETYEKWAKEASANVIRAKTIPLGEGLGTVQLMIVSNSGPADLGIISTIQQYINVRKCPSVTVKVITFVYVNIDITVEIILKPGYLSTDVDTTIQKALRNYLSYRTWVFGDDVYRQILEEIIGTITGVYTVNIDMPESIPITINQMPKLGVWTPTYTEYTPE